MPKASDGTPSSVPADVYATSQQVESNNVPTPSSTVHIELDMSQNAKADVGNHINKADVGDHIAGYIFMCNTATKPDCFMYRVFGLPASRLKVVQKIKPNTKLFLFDFDVKLFYGLYVADTSGQLALEPYAFGGRFPAQVRFSIAKDCLPLPEAVFKDVIKENYTGSKFKQELSDEQVNKLVSRFRPIDVPSSPHPSLGFGDALRSLFQKHVESSHQNTRYTNMHDERRVPEVPQIASAGSYYDQNPMPQSTVTPISSVVAPSSSMLPSSSRASHLVAVAARALNAESKTSSFISSSNVPSLSHAHLSYNGSSIREVGYGLNDQLGPSSHHALSVSSRAVHAYETHPYPVSSYYQNESNAALPQTLSSGSNGAIVDNTYLNYTSRNHPASINYGYADNQGFSALPQIQPSVNADDSNLYFNGTNSANLAYGYQNQGNATLPQTLASRSYGANADDTYLNYNSRNHPVSINYGYAHNQGVPTLPQIQPSVNADDYNGANSADLAYDYRNQGYYNSHQIAVGTSIQQSNNVPQVHQPYWSTTAGYMNQDYYSSGVPVAGADVTAGYAPVGGRRVYLT